MEIVCAAPLRLRAIPADSLDYLDSGAVWMRGSMGSKYRIVVLFLYGGTTPGGSLITGVRSKSAIERQLKADRDWCKAHGHTIVSERVEERGKNESRKLQVEF